MSKGKPTKGLWPVHLKPKEDELLSSWLTRLAIAHGLTPNNFCSLIWPSSHLFSGANLTEDLKKYILAWLFSDFDLIENLEILEVLVEGTGTPIAGVVATTFSAYKDSLYGIVGGRTHSWIMPVDFTPRKRIFGLQFCPKCLLVDKEPYYRRRWRLAFVTLCERHFIPLLDSCSRCGSCIILIARKNTTQHVLLTRCPSCQANLRTVLLDPASSKVNAEELKFQENLMEGLHQGWVDVPSSGYVNSHLYFKALHMLVDLLSVDETAFFRDMVSDYFRVPLVTVSLPKMDKRFEKLRVSERREVLGLVGLLLRDWPNAFIDFWAWLGLSLHRDPFTKDGSTDDIPFWFWSVLHDYVVKPEYRESYEEHQAKVKYMFRTTTSRDDYFRLSKLLNA